MKLLKIFFLIFLISFAFSSTFVSPLYAQQWPANSVTVLPSTCTPPSTGVAGSEPLLLMSTGRAIPVFCSQLNVYSPMVKNGTIFADSYTGAFDVKVRACVAAAAAAGGGICDATALYGAQTQTAEIDIGDGTASVTLLLAPYLTDIVTMNTAGACAFKIMNASRLIGAVDGITHEATIQSAASTNTGSLVCSNYVPGTGQYASAKGLILYNPSGGTFTNGALYTKNTFDGSSFSYIVIANYGGIGLHVQATCCATKFDTVVIDGGHVAGSIPLQIDSLQGDLQPVTATYFYNMSVDHPGTGLNAIKMTRTFNTTAITDNTAFFGLYMEGNSTDTTTPLISIDSFTRTSWNDVVANLRSTSSTQYVWNIINTSFSSNIPQTNISGFNYLNCTCTLPNDVVHDLSGVVAKTDAVGNMGGYMNGSIVGPMTIDGRANSAFTPSLTVTGTGNPVFLVKGNAVSSDADMRIQNTNGGGHTWEFGEMFQNGTFYMRDVSVTGLSAFGFQVLGTTTSANGIFQMTNTAARNWAIPDASFTFAGKDLAQSFTADQTFNTTSTGLMLPKLASAAPTVDGNIANDSTDHFTKFGSNGVTKNIPITQIMASSSGAIATTTLGQPGGMTALTWNVEAGKTYRFECKFYYQISSVTGVPSPAMAVGGTATYTTLWAEAHGFQTATLTTEGTVASAAAGKSTLVTTASTPVTTNLPFEFNGAFLVNAGGTMLVQAANFLNAAATVTIGTLGTCTLQ